MQLELEKKQIESNSNYRVQRISSDENKVFADKTNKVFSAKENYEKIKRVMDVALSGFAIVMLTPLFLGVSLAIKLDSKGSVIYSQKRVGKDGKLFTIYKFRSMTQDADARLSSLIELNERDGPAFKINNDPRVTNVGKFIRDTCIDELPQLFNIFFGDMSIVGPRPPLPKEVEQYNKYQLRRLGVTPGLTCFWQVQKNSETTFDEWVDLDLKYIRERSLLVDIKLILKTVLVVLFKKGDN